MCNVSIAADTRDHSLSPGLPHAFSFHAYSKTCATTILLMKKQAQNYRERYKLFDASAFDCSRESISSLRNRSSLRSQSSVTVT